MEFPKNLRYTKSHEWARTDGDNVVIGITAFAVDQLGDITLVDLPAVGSGVEVDTSFGTIESVKSVSDLNSPVAGKVTAINGDLDDSPELVNESPYDKGWLVRLEATKAADVEALLDAATYAELVAQED